MQWILPFSAILALSGCATVHRPFLYSAEKEGREIVLLGTMHLGVSAHDLPGVVSDELNSSNVAFFETDFQRIQWALESEGDHEAQQRVTREFYFRDPGDALRDPEPKLSERLPRPTWEQLKKRLPHLTPAALDEFNPAGALLLLRSGQTEEVSRYEANTLNPWNSMDLRLYSWAKKRGLRTLRLDRSDNVCKEELEADAVRSIQLALAGGAEAGGMDSFRELVEAYREGNEEKLRALAAATEEAPEGECLIQRRNQDWADKIGHFLMPGEKAFVAVGSMHLLSKRYPSLLRLLQEQGYVVKRISL